MLLVDNQNHLFDLPTMIFLNPLIQKNYSYNN